MWYVTSECEISYIDFVGAKYGDSNQLALNLKSVNSMSRKTAV